MPTARETVSSRWKPHWASRPSFRKIVRAFNEAQAAWDAIEACGEARKGLIKAGKLTTIGVNETMRGNLSSGVVSQLRRAEHQAKLFREEVALTRGGLGIPKPDRTDVASAILRSEYRTFMRGLDMGKLAALLMDPKADPAMLEAAWEVPAQMIGMDETIRENLRTAILERTNAEEIAVLEEMLEAATLVENTVQMSLQDVASAAGFRNEGENDFKLWLKVTTAEIDKEIAAESFKAPTMTPIDVKATADAIREMTNEQKQALFDFSIDSQIASIAGRPQPDAARVVEQV